MTTKSSNPQRYVTTAQVRQRYGGCSQMWIWRRERFDDEWPKPLIISGRKFYSTADLDRYDATLRKAGVANGGA